MSDILEDYLVKEGYRIVELAGTAVELWRRERLVARFTPSVSQAGLNQVAADDYTVARDWKLLRSEP